MRIKNILFCLIIILSMVTIGISAPENETAVKYWYQVGVFLGDKTVDYLGTSVLDETQFIKLLSGAEPLLLENLIFFSPTGAIKNFTEESFWLKGGIYLNPKNIVYVMPAKGDPREIKR